jgi:hypothetical protein
MLPYAEEVKRFVHALNETPSVWRSVDIRVIALFIDGGWHNLLTRCRIDSRAPEDIARLERLPSNDSLLCIQDVRDASSLDDLLGEIGSGRFVIDGIAISLREVTDSVNLTGPPYQSGYARLGTRESAGSVIQKPQYYVAHTLTISSARGGNHLTSLVRGGERSIDQFLRSLEYPWDGINGLGRVALATPNEPSRVYQPTVEFVAPLGVSIDVENTHLESGWLTVAVWAESLAAGKRCSVGYVAEFSDGAYLNGTLDLSRRRWKGRLVRNTIAQVKIGNAERVTLLLRLGSQQVEVIAVSPRGASHANIHAQAYLVIDPGLKSLRHVLERTEAEALKEKNGVREFEGAVARLLSAAGFQSDALGSLPGLNDAIDVLASAREANVVLAVECTLGALSSQRGKPSKLIKRVDELRQRVATLDVEIVPIMATCRQRSAISRGDVEYVAEDGVAVLAHEDLLEIATGIESGWGVETILSFCSERIGASNEEYHDRYLPEEVGGVVRRRNRLASQFRRRR